MKQTQVVLRTLPEDLKHPRHAVDVVAADDHCTMRTWPEWAQRGELPDRRRGDVEIGDCTQVHQLAHVRAKLRVGGERLCVRQHQPARH